jgi:NADH dehydrogenase [ubiquinone] 1 alpha subcomplex assembly factor 1
MEIVMGTIMMAIILDMSPGPWQAINDGVMGGISSGRMEQSGDILRFEGTLSLENNGGFASVRRPIGEDLSNATGVKLQVRGDGRTYQFRMRQDDRFDGIAWRAEFSTSGDWQTVELSFNEFIPVFRGRRVPEAGPVVPAAIRQIGFMLADKVPGPFALEIRSITFE